MFTDLGFEAAKAAILHMRAKLISDLRLFIGSTGMTEAEQRSSAQSRVADLMRGKWEKFSLEMLEARVGRKVTLELPA